MKRIISIAFFTLGFLFYSCGNFLNGADIKSEIEEKVAYSQAQDITFVVQSDDGTGKLLQSGSIGCKVGYKADIELQFTLNSETYRFGKWSAVSSADESVDRSDCVEFINQSADAEKGIYKTQIKIIKSKEDIVVKPLCFLIPKVTKMEPELSSAGVPQDSKIKITFNSPINREDFLDFTNISIYNSSGSLNDKFNAPVLSEDGLTLSIQKNKSIDLITDSLDYMDITVLIKTGKQHDGGGNVLREPLKDLRGQNFIQDVSWTYRVNASKDPVPPTISEVKLAKTEENLLDDSKLLTDRKFEDYADSAKINEGETVKENIKRNHVKTVWISGICKDDEAGSGIDKVVVKETVIRNTTGTETTGKDQAETTYYITDNRIKCISSGDKTIQFSLNHEFGTISDGVVRLEIFTEDCAGNASESIFFEVIKDTVCPTCSIFTNENKFTPAKPDESGVYTFKIFPHQSNFTPYIRDLNDKQYTEYFQTSDPNLEPELKVKKVSYGYSIDTLVNSELKETKIIKDSSYQGIFYNYLYFYEIKHEVSKDLIIRVVVEDDVGNETVNDFTIQKSNRISIAEGDTFTFTEQPVSLFALYYQYEDENGVTGDILPYCYPNYYNKDKVNNKKTEVITISSIRYTMDNNFVSSLADGKYYFYVMPVTNTGREMYYSFNFNPYIAPHGCIGHPYVYYKGTAPESSSPDNSVLPSSFTVEMDDPVVNTGKRTVHVKFNSGFTPTDGINYIVKYVVSGKTSATYEPGFDFEITSGKTYDVSIVASNAANKTVETSSVTIDATYDNFPPVISLSSNNSMLTYGNAYYLPFPKDTGVGIQEISQGVGKVKCFFGNYNNLTEEEINKLHSLEVTYSLEAAKKTTVNGKLPADAILIPFDSNDFTYMYVLVYDKNGNYAYKSIRLLERLYLDVEPVVECSAENKLSISSITTDEYHNQVFTLDVLKNGKWENVTYQTNNNAIDVSSEMDCLYRVSYVSQYNDVSGTWSRILRTKFIRPSLVKTPVTCGIKNLLEGMNGISVFCDAPAFIHTVYSKTNYKNDKYTWETRGLEAGAMDVQGSTNYTVPADKIPSGVWYTTICTYADDTYCMSEPKYMN